MPCGRIWPSSALWPAQGRDGIKELLKIIASEADARLPVDAHTSLVVLAAELQALQTLIGPERARHRQWCRSRHRTRSADRRRPPEQG
jgi:hypothetical protein